MKKPVNQYGMSSAVIHHRAFLLKTLHRLRYEIGQMDSGRYGDKGKALEIIAHAVEQCELPPLKPTTH